LTTVDVSEDESALLQAGALNLHSKMHDHGDYAPTKDVAYAKDEHKNDDTDTKVKYGENRHDKARCSAYAKEENHKYTYHQAQSTHYDIDYPSKNHDYTHSMAKDSNYDRYQKSDYDGGDHGESQDDVYAQGKDNTDDSYAKAKYDEDQHGNASGYGYAKEEKHKYTYHHDDSDYHGKNYDHAHSVVKDSHYDRYQKRDYDVGDSSKNQDDAYAQGKDKADDSYAKVKYGEDQHGKASVYGYAKEEKDKYTYRHAKSNQYDSDYPANNYHYAHSTTKDSYADHYKNSEYGHGDSGKVGDEIYTQEFDESDKAVYHPYAKKHTTAKYDGYSGQHKEERYAHARKTYKYQEVSGKHKDNAAYAKGKTDHRDDYFRKGKARDYTDAKQKKTKYGDYPEQGKSGNYPKKNTKYNDYSGQGQADINGLLKGLSKGDSYVKKDIKYDDHSRQDQADVKQLLNGIFTRLSKDDDAHAQQKTTKYRGYSGKRKADDSIDAAKQIADKFAKRKKTVLGRMNKYRNLHKWGLWKGVFRGHSKEDMSQHHDYSAKRMEASKGHAKTTAGNDETDDYRRADKHGDRQITGSGVTKSYLLSHKRDRHHRFINGRWLRGRLGHWRYLADAKEKATKQDYSGKLKESSYAYAKQSKKDLDSYSGIGKDSKGKHDDYSGIGMADDFVDANTLTTEHGDYSWKGKMVQ